MIYKQLSLEEREHIYALKLAGFKITQIARRLNRHHSSIGRELRKNARYGKGYIPCKAQELADKRAKDQRTKAPLKNPLVFVYVRKKLRLSWSPETISGRLSLEQEHICPETIYQYIYGKGKHYKLWEYLPKAHKKRKTTGRSVHKKARINGAISIEFRPKRIEKRTQLGHLETDLMEGKRTDKTVLSVEVERKTRYTMLTKLKNKKAQTKVNKVGKKLKTLQSLSKSRNSLVKSITTDNGPENTKPTTLSQLLAVKVYNTHPYSSWEKGTVENTIGRIRRYIPKGVSLNQYSSSQIQWLENHLNNTPRKCLDYLTPNEALAKEVNKHKFMRYTQGLRTVWCTST